VLPCLVTSCRTCLVTSCIQRNSIATLPHPCHHASWHHAGHLATSIQSKIGDNWKGNDCSYSRCSRCPFMQCVISTGQKSGQGAGESKNRALGEEEHTTASPGALSWICGESSSVSRTRRTAVRSNAHNGCRSMTCARACMHSVAYQQGGLRALNRVQ
jgi:hypothetical protein